MKRGWTLLLAALLAAALLSGCGGSASPGDPGEGNRPTAESEAMDTTASDSYFGGNGAPMEPQGEWEEAVEVEAGAADPRLQSAKLIHTGELELETTAFDQCAADLEALVAELGGYMEQASVNSGGTYRRGSYTVRVPAARFQDFLRRAGELCHVTYQWQSSENISEAYYDTESRLTTQQTKLARLQALLAQAETMEDIITIESAISDTELAIEQLTGTLRHYDALVDYATVRLELREVYKLSSDQEAPTSFGSRLGSAFTGGARAFADGAEDLAVALAYGWIWVLLLAAVGVIAVRQLRKRRAKRDTDPPAQK